MKMRRYAVAAILAAAAMAGGCSVATPGSTRLLGDVDYPQAFAAANDTMTTASGFKNRGPRMRPII